MKEERIEKEMIAKNITLSLSKLPNQTIQASVIGGYYLSPYASLVAPCSMLLLTYVEYLAKVAYQLSF